MCGNSVTSRDCMTKIKEEFDMVFAKTLSKKPITQLTVLEEHNIIITLCDSVLSIHNLVDLKVLTTKKLSNASLYAIDKSDLGVKIAVSLKRKISQLIWTGNRLEDVREVSVPDTAKLLMWAGTSLYAGIKKVYYQINLNTGDLIEVISNGKTGNLSACLLPHKQILLQKDQIGIFMGLNNKTTREFGVGWSSVPTSVEYSFPYIIGLLPKSVEIRPAFSCDTLCQSIECPQAKCIAVSNKVNINDDESSMRPGNVYVASRNQIWRLKPVDFGAQVDRLLQSREYESALSLATNVGGQYFENKEKKIADIQMLYAYQSFADGKYAESMAFFKNLNVDPILVISLYPGMLSSAYDEMFVHPVIMPTLSERNLIKALDALIDFLEVRRKEYNDSPSRLDSTNQTDWELTTDVSIIIDSVLLKACVKAKRNTEITALLSIPNSCHASECSQFLQAHQRFKDMVLLYKGKGEHEKALGLLKTFGEEIDERKAHDLMGPSQTINYLSKLGARYIDIILHFSKWVLARYPEEALKIFTAKREPGDNLPAESVLLHIKSVLSGNMDTISLKQKIITHFLEYAVLDRGDTSNELCNELIYQYFDLVIEKKKDLPEDQRGHYVVAGSEKGELGIMRTKLTTFLEENNSYNPEKMLSKFPFQKYGLYEERAILYSKIGEHGRALEEYVHMMDDKDQAERYCMKQYGDSEPSKDVFLLLIQVLLNSVSDPTKQEENRSFAFEILERHFDSLDTSKALELFPDDTKLSQMTDFFENVWRNMNQRKREGQVVQNIRRSENMKVKNELLRLRSRAIRITDDTICPSCNKKLGEAVFAYYPNGEVVHYRCHTRQLNKSKISNAH